MSRLGIIAGLMIVYGMAPVPLDPCLLQYYAFLCNTEAIHHDIFALYHPETAELIVEWNRIGPSGDVRPFQSHFVSYHNREVRSTRTIFKLTDCAAGHCIH